MVSHLYDAVASLVKKKKKSLRLLFLGHCLWRIFMPRLSASSELSQRSPFYLHATSPALQVGKVRAGGGRKKKTKQTR